jgi:hypothetical protein
MLTSLELCIAGEPHDHVPAPAVANSSKGHSTQGLGVRQQQLHPLHLQQVDEYCNLRPFSVTHQIMSVGLPVYFGIHLWDHIRLSVLKYILYVRMSVCDMSACRPKDGNLHARR